MSYRDAGVDISAGDSFVNRIKPFAKNTSRAGVASALGGFGGLFDTYLSYFLMERFWGLIIVVFIMSFTIIGLVEMLERRIAFYANTR